MKNNLPLAYIALNVSSSHSEIWKKGEKDKLAVELI